MSITSANTNSITKYLVVVLPLFSLSTLNAIINSALRTMRSASPTMKLLDFSAAEKCAAQVPGRLATGPSNYHAVELPGGPAASRPVRKDTQE